MPSSPPSIGIDIAGVHPELVNCSFEATDRDTWDSGYADVNNYEPGGKTLNLRTISKGVSMAWDSGMFLRTCAKIVSGIGINRGGT